MDADTKYHLVDGSVSYLSLNTDRYSLVSQNYYTRPDQTKPTKPDQHTQS